MRWRAARLLLLLPILFGGECDSCGCDNAPPRFLPPTPCSDAGVRRATGVAIATDHNGPGTFEYAQLCAGMCPTTGVRAGAPPETACGSASACQEFCCTCPDGRTTYLASACLDPGTGESCRFEATACAVAREQWMRSRPDGFDPCAAAARP